MKVLAIVLLLCISLLGTETGSLLIRTGGATDTVEINNELFYAEDSLISLDSLDPGWYRITAPNEGSSKTIFIELDENTVQDIRFAPDNRPFLFSFGPPLVTYTYTHLVESSMGAILQGKFLFKESRVVVGLEGFVAQSLTENYSPFIAGGMVKGAYNFSLGRIIEFEPGIGLGYIGASPYDHDFIPTEDSTYWDGIEVDRYFASSDLQFLVGRKLCQGVLGYKTLYGNAIGHLFYGGLLFRF